MLLTNVLDSISNYKPSCCFFMYIRFKPINFFSQLRAILDFVVTLLTIIFQIHTVSILFVRPFAIMVSLLLKTITILSIFC